MKKPVIGLTPLWDDNMGNLWMLPEYCQAVSEAGGIPLVLPADCTREEAAQLCSFCDGFLFTGGQDVAPKLYGEAPEPVCGPDCPQRDGMEAALFQAAYALNKPMLAICRGLQFVNVMLGGSLYQDIPSQVHSGISHNQGKPYHIPCHRVQVLPDTLLAALLQQDAIQVNSLHHQGIKALGEGLVPMAVAEDGLIEAAYAPDKPFVCLVQWHPEYAKDWVAQRLFAAFIKAANTAAS